MPLRQVLIAAHSGVQFQARIGQSLFSTLQQTLVVDRPINVPQPRHLFACEHWDCVLLLRLLLPLRRAGIRLNQCESAVASGWCAGLARQRQRAAHVGLQREVQVTGPVDKPALPGCFSIVGPQSVASQAAILSAADALAVPPPGGSGMKGASSSGTRFVSRMKKGTAEMRFHRIMILSLLVVLVSACGRAAEPDASEVAAPPIETAVVTAPAESSVPAVSTPVPTDTVSPTPTDLPATDTPTPTPTRADLADFDAESFLRSAGDPPGAFVLGETISTLELLEGIDNAINQVSIDIVQDDEEAKNAISLMIFSSLGDANSAFARVVEGFGDPNSDEAFVNRQAAIAGLGDQAKAATMATRVDGISNFAFTDMVFTRCQALVFLRLVQPLRDAPYSQAEMADHLQDTAVYLQTVDTALAPLICPPGFADGQVEKPLVIMADDEVPAKEPTAQPTNPTANVQQPSPTRLAAATPRPSVATGSSLAAPVPYGETAQVTRNNGDAVFEVAVVDVVRGATAQQMMLDANMFNGRPEDPNLEWMLMRMRGNATRVNSPTGTVFGDPLDMRIYANQRVIGQPLGGIPPEPRLQGIYLTGARLDGWVAFFVPKDDPSPVVFIKDSFLNSKGVYFSLSPSSAMQSSGGESAVRAVVTSASANLRQGPGTNYAVLASTARGASYDISGRNAASTWWQVCCVNGQSVWVSNEVVTVQGDLSTVPLVEGASQPATPAQAPSQSAGQWTLVADSVADYPTNVVNRRWWYLWSEGRFNFRWQEMREDPNECARPPNNAQGFICAANAGADASADIALQWKAPEGGTYRIEWQSDTTKGQGDMYVYHHLEEVYGTGRGTSLPNSLVVNDIIAWDQFFFVVRSHGEPFETTLHVRVYRKSG